MSEAPRFTALRRQASGLPWDYAVTGREPRSPHTGHKLIEKVGALIGGIKSDTVS